MENIEKCLFVVESFQEPLNEENYKIKKFESWLNQYQKHGTAFTTTFTTFGKMNVFVPHLACILYSNIVFWCLDEQRNVEAIEVQKTFRKAYIDGYKDGLEYFKTEYKQLLFNAKDELLQQLKIFYFDSGTKNGLCGWNYVKDQVPLQFDLEALKKMGYYSALVSCVDDLAEKHPIIFKDFYLDKATTITTPPATEQRGFDLGLTEPQLTVLHQQLIDKDFLDKNTNLNHFINAFSGEVLDLDLDFKKIEWIDKPKTSGEFNSQTIFQLLFSCSIEIANEEKIIKPNIKVGLTQIFSNDLGNLNKKCKDFWHLKGYRQNQIDLIIKTLKG